MKNCVICGASLTKTQRKVCSRNCLRKHLGNLFRGKGKSPYIQIRVEGERVYLHRHVWEKANGRKLRDGELVHHVNEDKRDNRAENLEVLSGRAAHLHVHNYHKTAKAGSCEDFSEFGF